jgi:hypothetical protein
MTSKLDRAAGVLIGLAVGDKNLGPIHMATIVAESLKKNQNFEPTDIFGSYLLWFLNQEIGSDDTGVVGLKIFKEAKSKKYFESENKLELIEKISQQVDQQLKNQTAGINPAHRNVPLSMAKFINGEELIEFASLECQMTHQHRLAQESAIVSNLICRHNIEGKLNFMEILSELQKESFDELTVEALKTPSLKFKPNLDKGGFSPKTLQTVLCFVDKYTRGIDFQSLDDCKRQEIFKECLNDSFKFAGHPNYSPVLVGSIMGVSFGNFLMKVYCWKVWYF